MVDVKMLQRKIKEAGMTTKAVCDKSGILRQTLYSRYKNPNFTTEEINALKTTLRLTTKDVVRIFFARDVNSK